MNIKDPPQANQIDLDRLLANFQRARREINKAVIGQSPAIEQLLIALLCEGHVLLEGAPGVGKTLLVRTLAKVTGLQFSRIQFTPDLMPADVTGSMTLQPDESGHSNLRFQSGPIFTQLLLADEINRATPKTQSSLLEAMQERKVTISGTSKELPRPFFVLATQNPLEMDGTYQLPEAQIDRFLFKSILPFPSEVELDQIITLTTGQSQEHVSAALTSADLIQGQELVRCVPIASHVRQSVARFITLTQPDLKESSPQIRKYVRFGVSPRGAQALVLAAKGHALLNGRFNVSFEDLRSVLLPSLRHRFQLNFEAQADGIQAETIIAATFDTAVGSFA